MTIPNRRKLIILVLVIGVIVCATAILLLSKGPAGLAITIENNTQIDVTGLQISYEHITKDIEIPDIKAGTSYRLVVNPTENFGENHMLLYYLDKTGTKQSEIIVGYFEKGYSGKVNVKIKSVNDKGVFQLDVDEDIL